MTRTLASEVPSRSASGPQGNSEHSALCGLRVPGAQLLREPSAKEDRRRIGCRSEHIFGTTWHHITTQNKSGGEVTVARRGPTSPSRLWQVSYLVRADRFLAHIGIHGIFPIDAYAHGQDLSIAENGRSWQSLIHQPTAYTHHTQDLCF